MLLLQALVGLHELQVRDGNVERKRKGDREGRKMNGQREEDGGREGGREGGRKGGSERGMEGGREGGMVEVPHGIGSCILALSAFVSLLWQPVLHERCFPIGSEDLLSHQAWLELVAREGEMTPETTITETQTHHSKTSENNAKLINTKPTKMFEKIHKKGARLKHCEKNP